MIIKQALSTYDLLVLLVLYDSLPLQALASIRIVCPDSPCIRVILMLVDKGGDSAVLSVANSFS